MRRDEIRLDTDLAQLVGLLHLAAHCLKLCHAQHSLLACRRHPIRSFLPAFTGSAGFEGHLDAFLERQFEEGILELAHNVLREEEGRVVWRESSTAG